MHCSIMTLKSAMITSIRAYISSSVMPPGFTNNPSCVIVAVKIHVDVTSPADRRVLEWESESLLLATCDNFND